jgi:hypothetical protein
MGAGDLQRRLVLNFLRIAGIIQPVTRPIPNILAMRVIRFAIVTLDSALE